MRNLWLISLMALIIFVSASVSLAQESITEESIYECVRGKTLEDAGLSACDSLMLLLKVEEDSRNKLTMSITGSFKSDDAGDKNTTNLSSAVNITKGQYPGQLRFKAAGHLRYEDGEVEDDVTKYRLNYDYYVHPNIELYTFIEKFKDSYLGIHQRIEIGFGAKWENHLFGLITDKDTKIIEHLKTQMLATDTSTLSPYVKTALSTIKKRDSRLRIGLALTLFKEIEHPEDIVETINDIDTSFSIPSETLYRLVAYQSLIYRATEDLKITGLCFVKAAAFKGQFVDFDDIRVDAEFKAELSLKEDKHGNGNVSLTLGYNYNYDKQPPSIIHDAIKYEAENNHGTSTLGITIKI
ncbi:MAG: hypothetical protein V3V99_00125 [candidate division Zixibacteria bacterium]